jgi:hypothetical protein
MTMNPVMTYSTQLTLDGCINPSRELILVNSECLLPPKRVLLA